MNLTLVYQEERAQDYEPLLSGWQRAVNIEAAGASDEYLRSQVSMWQHSTVVRYPLWRFVAKEEGDGPVTIVTSSCPIEVEVKRGERLFFAENETLSIFAAGETEQDAINDFNLQVVCQFKHYQEIPDEQLVGQATQLKTIFGDSFKLE